jgi:hypothetical protein
MHNPPRLLISPRSQGIVLGLIAIALALGGFQAGRRSVDAAAVAKTVPIEPSGPVRDIAPPKPTLLEHDQDPVTMREIATVPFSELYDVLKLASREQLLTWARNLERMPRGPRQRAAVRAYYKNLIQVDHHAALEALSQSTNPAMRDLGVDALLRAAPESIWQEIAETLSRIPGRGGSREDVILNWSRVDPGAASQFIEKHPASGEDYRLSSLLTNWGEIDPSAAKNWLEADASRQTKDAFRAFLPAWGRADPAAAIEYAVANVHRPNFEAAVNELVYEFVRTAKVDATRLILLLPTDQAIAAVENAARITTTSDTDDFSADYQRPPAEVARWMVSLPVEFWKNSVGAVAREWLQQDAASATSWFGQLPPGSRDAAIISSCRAAAAKSQYGPVDEIIELGLTISDDDSRHAALGELVRSMQTTVPGAMSAIERINDLAISEEKKEYLRGFITGGANGR